MALATGNVYEDAFPGRTFKSPLTKLLVENGRNGNSQTYLELLLVTAISVAMSWKHLKN